MYIKIDPRILAASGVDPLLAYQVGRHEGCNLRAYPDPNSPLGKAQALPLDRRPKGWQQLTGTPWTIGWGHTGREVHAGLVWLQPQADTALCADLASDCTLLARGMPWTGQLDPVRRRVLQDMVFNLGYSGLLNFPSMLSAAKRGDFARAAWEMQWTADPSTPATHKATPWSLQAPQRCAELAAQMETGIQQPPGVDMAAATAAGMVLAA